MREIVGVLKRIVLIFSFVIAISSACITDKDVKANNSVKEDVLLQNQRFADTDLIGVWVCSKVSFCVRQDGKSSPNEMFTKLTDRDSSCQIAFDADHTFTVNNTIKGSWRLKGNELILVGSDGELPYFLPVNCNYRINIEKTYFKISTNLKNFKNGTYSVKYLFAKSNADD